MGSVREVKTQVCRDRSGGPIWIQQEKLPNGWTAGVCPNKARGMEAPRGRLLCRCPGSTLGGPQDVAARISPPQNEETSPSPCCEIATEGLYAFFMHNLRLQIASFANYASSSLSLAGQFLSGIMETNYHKYLIFILV